MEKSMDIFHKTIVLLLAASLSVSCQKDEAGLAAGAKVTDGEQVLFRVESLTRALSGEDDYSLYTNNHFTHNKTRMRIQLGDKISFSEEDGYYEYIYDNDELYKKGILDGKEVCAPNTYNFKPYTGSLYQGRIGPSLKWIDVVASGNQSMSGGAVEYSINAAIFSQRYELLKDNSVLVNQETLEDLWSNDLLLACAKFGQDGLGTDVGLYFRHVFCMLFVEVSVPIFSEHDGFGFNPVETDQLEDTEKDATRKLNPDAQLFLLGWSARYTIPALTSTSPTREGKYEDSQIPMVSADASEESVDLNMCCVRIGEETDDPKEDAVQAKIQKYLYCVIFPEPSGTIGQDQNLLRFVMKDPYNVEKHYVYATGDGDNLKFSRGYITKLNLYLPRNSEKPVLIESRIMPWNYAEMDMYLEPDE